MHGVLRLALFALAVPLVAACARDTGGVHARFGWSEEGLRVVEVPPRGPADRAGLRPDDRIVTIDGTPVSTLSMREAVEQLRGPIGSELKLKVLREGETIDLVVRRAPYRRH